MIFRLYGGDRASKTPSSPGTGILAASVWQSLVCFWESNFWILDFRFENFLVSTQKSPGGIERPGGPSAVIFENV